MHRLTVTGETKAEMQLDDDATRSPRAASYRRRILNRVSSNAWSPFGKTRQPRRQALPELHRLCPPFLVSAFLSQVSSVTVPTDARLASALVLIKRDAGVAMSAGGFYYIFLSPPCFGAFRSIFYREETEQKTNRSTGHVTPVARWWPGVACTKRLRPREPWYLLHFHPQEKGQSVGQLREIVLVWRKIH